MHAHIVLQSPHQVYTNLDFIRGKIVLQPQSMTAISSVTVKLEGVSRTRLISPGRPDIGERPQPREELHKVLYKVETVLAPDQADSSFTSQKFYTLAPGQYEYPFQFKVPFNNVCVDQPELQDFNIGLPGFKLPMQMARPSMRHVKTTLPPTVTAFPGLAEIKYFLKATVNRKEFYKENMRIYQPFNFLPIEPPRPPHTSAENYARRQHQFSPSIGSGSSKGRGFFSSGNSTGDVDVPPAISVDARLPNPAIITCNHDIPLRLLVKRLNESKERLYLQSLHIELVGHTHVRAHDVFRDETSSWVIATLSNMNVLLDRGESRAADAKGQNADIIVDSGAWRGKALPNSVAPTFETCNISRRYELIVRIGIGYGSSPAKNVIILPLQMPISVYSGIRPPDALLAAMSNRPPMSMQKPPNKKPLSQAAQANLAASQTRPPQPPRPHGPPDLPPEEEPPPSYEDAIAQDLAPIDGPRNYQPPDVTVANGGFPNDEKRRRDS